MQMSVNLSVARRAIVIVRVVCLSTACLAAVVKTRAVTAVGLASFEAIEEPLVKFYPASGKFVPDDWPNIIEAGDGVFRMSNRFRADWWDGDRDTRNKDRQRAEVKGLGPHQRDGAVFIYSTTWRLNPEFRGTAGFCHLFQLKSINGDSGSPLVTLSIHGDKATVEGNPAGPKIVAREFSWKPGVWQTVRIRIKTSTRADGELLVSVDGDDFVGQTRVALFRPEADEYRPKWGLYRKAVVGAKMGDDWVEHKNVSAEQLGAPSIENATLERETRQRALSAGPEASLAWLQAQPASPSRDFVIASMVAWWAQVRPVAALDWAAKLPPGHLHDDAVARAFSRLSDSAPAAAGEWLRDHAPRAALDPVVWLFVTDTTFRYVNRPLALEAAPLIHDAALRANAFEHVAGIWARDESAAAIAFVEHSAALTSEQKKAIVAKIAPAASGKQPLAAPVTTKD